MAYIRAKASDFCRIIGEYWGSVNGGQKCAEIFRLAANNNSGKNYLDGYGPDEIITFDLSVFRKENGNPWRSMVDALGLDVDSDPNRQATFDALFKSGSVSLDTIRQDIKQLAEEKDPRFTYSLADLTKDEDDRLLIGTKPEIYETIYRYVMANYGKTYVNADTGEEEPFPDYTTMLDPTQMKAQMEEQSYFEDADQPIAVPVSELSANDLGIPLGGNPQTFIAVAQLTRCPTVFDRIYRQYKQTHEEVYRDMNAKKAKELREAQSTDPRIISGTPESIYASMYEYLKKEIPGNSYPEPKDFADKVHQIDKSFDTKMPVSFDLRQVDMTTLLSRIGINPPEDQRIGLGAVANACDSIKGDKKGKQLFDHLEEKHRPSKEPSPEEAAVDLRAGKFVNLQGLAKKGVIAGQMAAVGMLSESMNNVAVIDENAIFVRDEDEDAQKDDQDRVDEMKTMLDRLKNTEGKIFMNASKEYRSVRSALENVIKLHTDMAKYLKAEKDDPKFAEYAKKAPKSEQLEEAYAALDKAAETYLKVKNTRLTDRIKAKKPDPVGQSRYNAILSLRTITCNAFRSKQIGKMAVLDEQIDRHRTYVPQQNKQNVRMNVPHDENEIIIST